MYSAGKKFNNLTILSLSKKTGSRNEAYYNCVCICNKKKVVRKNNLGRIIGCGCERRISSYFNAYEKN